LLENSMRLTPVIAAATVAVTTLSTTAIAGGLGPTVVTPTVIVDEPPVTRSSWGIILPIAAVALLIALAGSNGGGDE
jgi:hypothetical protein